ncbi:hypothetical protein EHQ12_11245 [Leptospira gomenensis]|uniref:Glycosyltransferase RgtA/B/C/D-like domain-containing protein n=1 Tax=Leptospira gomenensis TaxID=2484974 RepID=A0A5F1Y9W1_9LEPT|nr:hypothetical protein [Leptospira gomenensis]TGK33355.1 hypothetical protein EHQ17_11225 [Leptospira gomenensis]TGK37350.1 hypothetical protein EHQ12_11245 [Leptospira gomenensis]TGK40539.1 hypothetical protein EHQ07_18290 [Leptospira gomenensis]TGK56461.1 hypothetical protein EHQ13_14855 [Leptospira gomenensis]
MRKSFWFWLFLFLPAIYYVGAVLSWDKKKKLPITGDEPHYIMISESLFADRDFDLANNYREDEVSKRIIGPVDVERHTIAKGEKRFSIHSAGTAFLVWIGYAFSGIKGARIALALFAGLLPFIFYGIARIWEISKVESTLLSLAYSAALPFPLAAGQIFPDLPSGIVISAIALFAFAIEERNNISKKKNILFFVCGFSAGFLVWLHVKNAPISIVILIWITSLKRTETGSKRVLWTGAAVPFFLLLISNLLWFGNGLGPYSETDGSDVPPTVSFDLAHWVTVFAGLWTDRNQGIWFQNPLVWIFGSIGWIRILKNRKFRRMGVLFSLIVLLQLNLNAAHPCSYGCLSLPGRFQWSSAPLLFTIVACGWAGIRPRSAKIAFSLLVISVAYQFWIGKYWFDHVASLYHTMQPDPSLRPGFFPEAILSYLPSWTDTEESWKSGLNWIWLSFFVSVPFLAEFLFTRNGNQNETGPNP